MARDRQVAETLRPETSTGTPGETLKRTREALNYGLDDMSRRLHLSPAVIDALEEDRYEELPEPPYVRGYLRSYARFLGLDPAPLLARYEAIAGPQEAFAPGAQGSAAQGLHRATVVWGSLAVVAGLAILLWSWWSAHRPEQIPAGAADMAASTALGEDPGMLQEMPHELAGSPSLEARSQGAAPEGEQGAAAVVEAAQSQAGAVGGEAPPTQGVTAQQAPAPDGEAPAVGAVEAPAPIVQETPAPVVRPRPGGGRDRLRLAFSVRSWTEVYDADNRRLLFDLVKPGAVKTVEGRAPFRVILGDANGVQVSIDGVPFDHSAFRRRGKTARFQVGRPGAD